ncbi:efflux RND transporter periplasmic adaptor subunit [Aquabacterium sp.]|uniref:efflux RND transporter periplasmic adaptor subunit n=1 Tax=Aquabacterium sp. TaxID=1872578 RepID=UPI0035B0054C
MKVPRVQRRTLAVVAVVLPLLLVFVYVAIRSGPLAPVAVTVTTVQNLPVTPALSGLGTVQARYTHKIGPTAAGRLQRLDAQVGDVVHAGQVLGEMDAVDLNDRIAAQQAAIQGAQAALRQAEAKHAFAQIQARRYEQLLPSHAATEEYVATKQQDLVLAQSALTAAREDARRLQAELQALQAQRGNLRLVSPVAGIVAARQADPGSTVVAGQPVVEVFDPASVWVDARFDQVHAEGLAPGLHAQVTLRSRHSQAIAAHVLRIEPRADAVTEETLAKVVLDTLPAPLPPLGELAEITVQLPALPAGPVIANAAIRTLDGRRGVWKLAGEGLVFTPVTLGRADLDGRVQVTQGLAAGDRVVLYSEKALTARSRIRIVERLHGVAP